jgi:CheY-like chemotaxis protein
MAKHESECDVMGASTLGATNREGRRTVMVVDDDNDIRGTIEQILSEEGYVVETASDGADALEKLQAMEAPGVIFLDLSMPKMDGVTFRERQLENPSLAQIPVVVMSAAGGLPEKVKPLQVFRYLRKPLNIDELLDMAATFCGGIQLQAADGSRAS